jgi:hypothetical protein
VRVKVEGVTLYDPSGTYHDLLKGLDPIPEVELAELTDAFLKPKPYHREKYSRSGTVSPFPPVSILFCPRLQPTTTRCGVVYRYGKRRLVNEHG